MLELSRIGAAYGKHVALVDIDLFVDTSEIVVILGANGAGKSTLLKVIAGIVPHLAGGSVTLGSRALTELEPHEIVEAGVALVPEGRGIFAELTVRENLMLGAHPQRARADEARNRGIVLDLFPRLKDRMTQTVRTMSGGEQQMVAIGRAMMSAPEVLAPRRAVPRPVADAHPRAVPGARPYSRHRRRRPPRRTERQAEPGDRRSRLPDRDRPDRRSRRGKPACRRSRRARGLSRRRRPCDAAARRIRRACGESDRRRPDSSGLAASQFAQRPPTVTPAKAGVHRAGDS